MSTTTDSSSARAKTPPLVRSQLAGLLADATREIDALKQALAMSPSSRISKLEEQLRSAEERAGKAEADLTKVVGMWTQLKVYLDAMDVRSKDARIGFDRIVEGVSPPGMSNGTGELVDVEQVGPAPVVPGHVLAGPPPAPKEVAAAALLPPRKRRRKVTPQNDPTMSVATLPLPPAPTGVVVVAPNGNAVHPHSPHSSSSTVSLDVDEMLLNATTSHQDQKKRKRRASSISSSFSVPHGSSVYPPTPPATAAAIIFPTHTAEGQRQCRQCGNTGRYKDGKCTEKWGSGPIGPGSLCEKCKRKAKKAEKAAAALEAGTAGTTPGMSRTPSHSTPTVTTPRVIRQTVKDHEPHSHHASPYPVYADSTQHSSPPPSAPMHSSPKLKGEHVDVDMDIEMLLDRRQPSPSSRFYNRSEYTVSVAPPSTPPAPPHLKARVEEDVDVDVDVDVDADLDLLEAVDAAEASRTP